MMIMKKSPSVHPINCYLFLIILLIIFAFFTDAHHHRVKTFGASNKREVPPRLGSPHPRWNYQDIDSWGDISEMCVTGRRQSPIHIATHEAMMDPVLFSDPLQFINYGGTFYGTLLNTGHTIMWQINASSTPELPRITGSGLGPDGYVLDQFHFHWGGEQADSNCLGSEHVIDYRSGPMELHMVHHNAKYPSFDVAQSKPDGLATLGFILTPVDNNNIQDGDYAQIANLIPQISKPASKTVMSANFAKLIPLAMLRDGVYFRYLGSMTAPPCYETVTWTVFADRIPISAKSLAAFRNNVKTDVLTIAVSDIYETLDNNFRPIQRLNGRVVTTNSRDAQVPPGFNPPMARQGSVTSSQAPCYYHKSEKNLSLITLPLSLIVLLQLL